jgi:hypothetical protein
VKEKLADTVAKARNRRFLYRLLQLVMLILQLYLVSFTIIHHPCSCTFLPTLSQLSEKFAKGAAMSEEERQAVLLLMVPSVKPTVLQSEQLIASKSSLKIGAPKTKMMLYLKREGSTQWQ